MRKAPRQERSQFMVSTILQATARVFDRRGMALTTRDVAEEAGVSVGSLYQYFKNKEELLSALVNQLGQAVADIAMRDIASSERWIIEGAAAVAVAGMQKLAERYQGKRVAVILCGRNILLEKFLEAVQ